MMTILSHRHQSVRLMIFIALLAVMPLAILFLQDAGIQEDSMTGNVFLASVSILPRLESLIYEDRSAGYTSDVIFQIGPAIQGNGWYSYNGTYGGIQAGYDVGTYSDNFTETFTITNRGTITVDITVASSDFDNGTIGDNNSIDINRSDGSFQIYIPTAGWKDIPDNDDSDEDQAKDATELCVADNLMINETIKGIDFQIRPQAGLKAGNYTGKVLFTAYDSSKINPCTGIGTYIIP